MMIDLTQITSAFGLLDDATKAALMAHHRPIEIFEGLGWRELDFFPSWSLTSTYRAKSRPKPSIDWTQVTPNFKWLAQDGYGSAYLYENQPESGHAMWKTPGEIHEVRAFVSYDPGDCDWRDSLIQRPEGS
jgi:hypothetical protein